MIDFDPEWWNGQRARLSLSLLPPWANLVEAIPDIAGKSEKSI